MRHAVLRALTPSLLWLACGCFLITALAVYLAQQSSTTRYIQPVPSHVYLLPVINGPHLAPAPAPVPSH